jgi:hypothetical protein
MFQQWFSVKFYSVVESTLDEPIVDDEDYGIEHQ